MSITLYISEVSAPSRAVLMTAHLIGLRCSIQQVNCVAKKTMRPEIKNNTLPVLQDEDLFVSDSHAIITYMVSKYGANRKDELYPSDLALRAIVDMRLYFNASKFSKTLEDIVKAILDEKVSEISKNQIEEVNERYTALESYLEENKFLAGDNLTVADVSVVSTIHVLSSLVFIDEEYEELKTWYKMLMSEYWFMNANDQISVLKEAMKKNRGK